MFLKGMLEHPVLAHSPLFVVFVTQTDRKAMGKEFEKMEKMEPPHCLSELSTKQGHVTVELS